MQNFKFFYILICHFAFCILIFEFDTMSLEIIKEKILAEGAKEAGQILAGAKEEAQKMKDEAKQRIQARSRVFTAEMKHLQEASKEQMRIQVIWEAKNNLLRKKQALIDEVFSRVLESLAKQEPVAQQKLLKMFLKNVRKHLGKEKVKIIPTANSQSVLAKLMPEYSSFKLSNKIVKGKGGFIAASDLMEEDYIFDHLMAEKRQELESEVAKILFR